MSADAESPTSSRASDLAVFRITLRLRRNLTPGAARKPIDADFGALKLSRLQTSVHSNVLVQFRKMTMKELIQYESKAKVLILSK